MIDHAFLHSFPELNTRSGGLQNRNELLVTGLCEKHLFVVCFFPHRTTIFLLPSVNKAQLFDQEEYGRVFQFAFQVTFGSREYSMVGI